MFLKGSGYLDPPEVFAHSKKPLDSLADLKGWKFRTAGDGGAIIDLMGGTAVAMPAGEVYDSLKRGVIDAAEWAGPRINWDAGFQEISEYMYISSIRSPCLFGDFGVNKNAWAELTPEQQLIVADISRLEAVRYHTEIVLQDAIYLKNFEEYGTKILPVPQDIVDEMRKQSDIHYATMGEKDPAAAEVIESLKTFREIWDGYKSLW